jgi:type IV pilus assembly protein PilB
MVGHDLPVGNILSNKIQNPSSIGDRGSKGRRVALKLGEMMVESGLIDKEQLLLALKSQRANGGKLGENLVRVGALLDEEEIASFVAKQMNLGKIALTDIDLEEDTVKLIPEDLAIKYTVIAVSRTNKVLTVATSDPKNVYVLDAIKFITGCTVKPVVAPESQIKASLEKFYQGSHEKEMQDILGAVGEDMEVVKENNDDAEAANALAAVDDAPLVKLVNKLLMDAIRMRASDIHVEIYEKVMRVRYRVDGTLREISTLPFKLRHAIISRLKIMANLDISERRLPQDGRIKLKTPQGKTVDLRVNTLPCIFGEKVVMRILDQSNLQLDLIKLGLHEKGLNDLKEAIDAPFGMILVTGPTGSGKSTTLYSAMSTINDVGINIMTAEDPVEYNLHGINQVQVHSEIGLTFAAALRAFLRQDPDVIMVGEMRDLETAEIGVKAALTGHLVLSTLHTNDAPSTINRLIDMGIEPFLVASSCRLIIAQRLVRKVCQDCKMPDPDKTLALQRLLRIDDEAFEKLELKKGKGCDICNGSGYKGRQGIYEIMPISTAIKQLIIDRASIDEIRQAAINDGVLTLRSAALRLLELGQTTAQEVIRSTDS